MSEDGKRTANVELDWHSTPTFFVDQMIGFTAMDGIGRAVLAQITFKPNTPAPTAEPVVTLLGTLAGWQRLKTQVEAVIQTIQESDGEIGDPVPVEQVRTELDG